MTRRDWWFGVVLIVLAVLSHAVFPRYTVLTSGGEVFVVTRFDRWTGRAEISPGIPTSPPIWLTAPKR